MGERRSYWLNSVFWVSRVEAVDLEIQNCSPNAVLVRTNEKSSTLIVLVPCSAYTFEAEKEIQIQIIYRKVFPSRWKSLSTFFHFVSFYKLFCSAYLRKINRIIWCSTISVDWVCWAREYHWHISKKTLFFKAKVLLRKWNFKRWALWSDSLALISQVRWTFLWLTLTVLIDLCFLSIFFLVLLSFIFFFS